VWNLCHIFYINSSILDFIAVYEVVFHMTHGGLDFLVAFTLCSSCRQAKRMKCSLTTKVPGIKGYI
jgi:hypothetical protein